MRLQTDLFIFPPQQQQQSACLYNKRSRLRYRSRSRRWYHHRQEDTRTNASRRPLELDLVARVRLHILTARPNPSMSDDDEIPVFYPDARDSLLTSAADARCKALKHFDYFLEGYCVQIGIKTVKGGDIPYHGVPHKLTDKAVSEFWDNLMGAFVTYLGKHARAACKPTGQHLQSAFFPSGHYFSTWIKFAKNFDSVNHLPETFCNDTNLLHFD
jgi:hypothetical protein